MKRFELGGPECLRENLNPHTTYTGSGGEERTSEVPRLWVPRILHQKPNSRFKNARRNGYHKKAPKCVHALRLSRSWA